MYRNLIFPNNISMKILIFCIVILILLNFIYVSVSFSSKRLIIYFFALPLIIKNKEEYSKLIDNMIKKLNDQDDEKKDQEKKIINLIKCDKLVVCLYSKVNNYHNFLQINYLLNLLQNYFYPLYKHKLPCLKFKYLKNKNNYFYIKMNLHFSLYKVVFELLKGKIYGKSKSKYNA